MVRSVCLLLENTDKTAWSDKHTRDFLNNNKKAKQQQKATNKLHVGPGEMNEFPSKWIFLSAMNMCSPGNRNQKSPVEFVQLIWVQGKRNIYPRHWRKHYDAERYGFITEEKTIQSYKTTQCTSLLMVHKIEHHSPHSPQQFQCDILPCQVWLVFFSR